MIFQSKVDRWLLVFCWSGLALLPVIMIAQYVDEGRVTPVLVVTFALVAALLIWMFRSTFYRIDGEELLVRSGLFRWRVPIGSIRAIAPTRDVMSGPALSLDRLRIRYRGKREEKELLVSPLDKDGFVAALRERNPQIELLPAEPWF